MHGRNNGKKLMAARIVKHCFDIINLTTDSNPIQILVDAIINGGPREDATRIGSAGVVRRCVLHYCCLLLLHSSCPSVRCPQEHNAEASTQIHATALEYIFGVFAIGCEAVTLRGVQASCGCVPHEAGEPGPLPPHHRCARGVIP